MQCNNGSLRLYKDVQTKNNNRPPHGILIGAPRCSSALTALARISGLERVPHLSPASNGASLLDEEEFAYFSRAVAPNNQEGEVGALVALLQSFNWECVTILVATGDTPFSQDAATEFRKILTGQQGGWFGRVHAFQILKQAGNLQSDTVWVGLSAWAGQNDPNADFSWLPSTPGYLGVAPFCNRDDVYQNFMSELQMFQQARGKEPWGELPVFATEFVDSIVAMTKALSAMPNRRDGSAVVQALRALEFDTVSAGLLSSLQMVIEKNPSCPNAVGSKF